MHSTAMILDSWLGGDADLDLHPAAVAHREEMAGDGRSLKTQGTSAPLRQACSK